VEAADRPGAKRQRRATSCLVRYFGAPDRLKWGTLISLFAPCASYFDLAFAACCDGLLGNHMSGGRRPAVTVLVDEARWSGRHWRFTREGQDGLLCWNHFSNPRDVMNSSGLKTGRSTNPSSKDSAIARA
jgi:hypothetical protein